LNGFLFFALSSFFDAFNNAHSIMPTLLKRVLPRSRRLARYKLFAASVGMMAFCAPCPAEAPVKVEPFTPAQREAALTQMITAGQLKSIVIETTLWKLSPPIEFVATPFQLPAAFVPGFAAAPLFTLSPPISFKPSLLILPSLIAFESPPRWTLPSHIALGTEIPRDLAAGYAAVGDERAVPYYEQVFAEIKTPQVGMVTELWDLAAYYESAKDYRKAADTYARAEQYSKQPFFWDIRC